MGIVENLSNVSENGSISTASSLENPESVNGNPTRFQQNMRKASPQAFNHNSP
jgi:hypothetical protein